MTRAEVRVEADVVGRIGQGHLLLVGFRSEDGPEQISWMADKVVELRVFPDEDGKMNRSLRDIGGALLVVSQFTLYGDTTKGRRPSFVDAAPPDLALGLYEDFLRALRSRSGGVVETGEFGAAMEVDLVNDGPVTLVLERV